MWDWIAEASDGVLVSECGSASADEPCSLWGEGAGGDWRSCGLPLTTCPPAPQDAFFAFHRDLDLVRKFMKPLLIGELAPEEPSQDGPQNVSRALVEAKPPERGQ